MQIGFMDEKNLRWKYIFKYIYINVYMIIL